mgnify:CR=1 FL=1
MSIKNKTIFEPVKIEIKDRNNKNKVIKEIEGEDFKHWKLSI